MAEQIILNTDLYDNLLTERKGDYTAKPRITGTLYNTDIAARIVAARTEYQHGTILNILDMADSHKVQAIAEGKSVVDGVGQYLVNVQGAFEGEKAQFEPGKHALGITYTMGKLLRETLKLVKVVVNGVAAVGPVINTVTDSTLQGHQRAAQLRRSPRAGRRKPEDSRVMIPPSVSTSPPPPKGPRR